MHGVRGHVGCSKAKLGSQRHRTGALFKKERDAPRRWFPFWGMGSPLFPITVSVKLA